MNRWIPASSSLLWLALPLSLAAGCSGAVEVELTRPQRKAIEETFSEPGRTRLPQVYTVSMPVEARIGRVELEVGDAVEAGQVLVELDRLPLEQALLEAQAAVAELRARIAVNEDHAMEQTAKEDLQRAILAGEQALKAADAQVAAARARQERARLELERLERLAEPSVEGSVVAQRELDDARLAAETALIELREQEFQNAATAILITALRLGPRFVDERISNKRLERAVLEQQLSQAQARLAVAKHRLALASVRAPRAGVVLARHTRGEAPLRAGQALLELGDLASLEVVADVLSEDALRLREGSEVRLDPGAGGLLRGEVARIEPAGFTKLSALGVEQQRVRVIVRLAAPAPSLGVGFRVQARFVTGRAQDALVVPRYSVLQAPGGDLYALVVRQGRLEKRSLKVGLQSDVEVQITEGLSERDLLVETPETGLSGGEAVRAREPDAGE